MARPAKIHIGKPQEVVRAEGLRLPTAPDALKRLLYQIYRPVDAEEIQALQAVFDAYVQWQCTRVGGDSQPVSQIYRLSRQVATRRLHDALQDLLLRLRRRSQGRRWPHQTDSSCDARLRPDQGYLVWQPAWGGQVQPLETDLLRLCEATDPSEAMAVAMVADAFRDFERTKDRRADPWTDRSLQQSHQQSSEHLQDMVAALGRLQAWVKRHLVRLISVRRVATPRARRGSQPGRQTRPSDEMSAAETRFHTDLWGGWAHHFRRQARGLRPHRGRPPVVEDCVTIAVQDLVRHLNLPPEAASYQVRFMLFGQTIQQTLQLAPRSIGAGSGGIFESRCDQGHLCRRLVVLPGGERLVCRACLQLPYFAQQHNTHRQARSPRWIRSLVSLPTPPSVWTAIHDQPPAPDPPTPDVGWSVQAWARSLALPRQPVVPELTVPERTVAGHPLGARLQLLPIDLPVGGGYCFQGQCGCGRRCRKVYPSLDGQSLVCGQCHQPPRDPLPKKKPIHRPRRRRPHAVADPPPIDIEVPSHRQAHELDRQLALPPGRGRTAQVTRARQLHRMRQGGYRHLGFDSFVAYLRQRQIRVAWAMFVSGLYHRLVVDAHLPESRWRDVPLGRLQGHLHIMSSNTAPDLLRAARRMPREPLTKHIRKLRGQT